MPHLSNLNRIFKLSIGFCILLQSQQALATIDNKLQIVRTHSGDPSSDGVITNPDLSGSVFMTLKNPNNFELRNLILLPQAGNCIDEMGGQIYQDSVPARASFEASPLYFKLNAGCNSIQAKEFVIQGAFDNPTTGSRESISASGQLLVSGAEVIFNADSLNSLIPDNGKLDFPMIIATDRKISNISLTVQITHPYLGDLQVFLIHPDGTSVDITNSQPAADGDKITFSVGYNGNAFAGLNKLIGKSTLGRWTLRIKDTEKDDAGSMNSVLLKIK